eukprot:5724359-Pleurochrysis_carterae.AAC.1
MPRCRVPWSLRLQGWLLSGIVKVFRFMVIRLGEDVLSLTRHIRRLQDELASSAPGKASGVTPA